MSIIPCREFRYRLFVTLDLGGDYTGNVDLEYPKEELWHLTCIFSLQTTRSSAETTTKGANICVAIKALHLLKS
jgi:hypothetical protein